MPEAPALPVEHNFELTQGDPWDYEIITFIQDKATGAPVDLTNKEVRMQIRDKPAADLTNMLILTLTTSDGSFIFVDPVTGDPGSPTLGSVKAIVSAAVTGAILITNTGKAWPIIQTFWYDMEIIDAQGPQTVMGGEWSLRAQITKPA